VDHIPYPEQLYLEICGMLFPSSASEAAEGSQTGPDQADD